MSTREVPEPWAAAMKAKSMTHRDRPSISRLAAAAGVSVETTRQLLYGGRRPEPDTVRAIAKALSLPAIKVGQWASQAWDAEEPYAPPVEAALLTRRQRSAVDELIRAMTEERVTDGPTTSDIDESPDLPAKVAARPRTRRRRP